MIKRPWFQNEHRPPTSTRKREKKKKQWLRLSSPESREKRPLVMNIRSNLHNRKDPPLAFASVGRCKQWPNAPDRGLVFGWGIVNVTSTFYISKRCFFVLRNVALCFLGIFLGIIGVKFLKWLSFRERAMWT